MLTAKDSLKYKETAAMQSTEIPQRPTRLTWFSSDSNLFIEIYDARCQSLDSLDEGLLRQYDSVPTGIILSLVGCGWPARKSPAKSKWCPLFVARPLGCTARGVD